MYIIFKFLNEIKLNIFIFNVLPIVLSLYYIIISHKFTPLFKKVLPYSNIFSLVDSPFESISKHFNREESLSTINDVFSSLTFKQMFKRLDFITKRFNNLF